MHKRKSIIITVILLMMLALMPVHAEDYATTISGTATSYVGALVTETYALTGANIDNLKGKITYDKKYLTLVSVESANDNWNFTFKEAKTGTITFEGTGSALSTDSTSMITVTFLAKTTIKSTKINFTGVTSSVTKEVEVTVNQKAIDEANKYNQENPETPMEVPEAVIERKTQTKDESIPTRTKAVKITTAKSSNSNLNRVEIENGSLSKEFYKGNHDQFIKAAAGAEVTLTAITEDSNATVEVIQEEENKITVTVTAQDGSTSTYNFTIDRTASPSGSSSTDNPVDPENPSGPVNNNPVTTNVLTDIPVYFIFGILAVGVLLIIIGSILVYQGCHVYEDEE